MREGAGGPSVVVPVGPGPGEDPVTAALVAACPPPWVGRGSVASGEVWVEDCCDRAGPALAISTATSRDGIAAAESEATFIMALLRSTVGRAHPTDTLSLPAEDTGLNREVPSGH